MHLPRQISVAMMLFLSLTCRAAEWITCPATDTARSCDFIGDGSIQAAVDAAADGDSILIRQGHYQPASFRDVPYKGLVIRGYVLVEDKRLVITGEPETILDGAGGEPTCAFVVNRAAVRFDRLRIRGFRAALADDDLYDGHGIFVIAGRVDIHDVEFREIGKMAITVRDQSNVRVSRARLLDGHVGIWAEEAARVVVRNTLFRGNDSAGIAAYGDSTIQVFNTVFDRNLDDGVYAAGRASIGLTNSLLTGNAPFALRAVEDGRIESRYNAFFRNQENVFDDGTVGRIVSSHVIEGAEPGLDENYRPVPGSRLTDAGDPGLFDDDGSRSDIGLFGGTVSPSREAIDGEPGP